MSKEELKPNPCLHCGSKDCGAIQIAGLWKVQCVDCQASGGLRATKAQAIAAWNKRHLCRDHEFVCNTCDHKCGIEVIESDGG